jgi:hypothetical protein
MMAISISTSELPRRRARPNGPSRTAGKPTPDPTKPPSANATTPFSGTFRATLGAKIMPIKFYALSRVYFLAQDYNTI